MNREQQLRFVELLAERMRRWEELRSMVEDCTCHIEDDMCWYHLVEDEQARLRALSFAELVAEVVVEVMNTMSRDK